jgi:hypothetical protein
LVYKIEKFQETACQMTGKRKAAGLGIRQSSALKRTYGKKEGLTCLDGILKVPGNHTSKNNKQNNISHIQDINVKSRITVQKYKAIMKI